MAITQPLHRHDQVFLSVRKLLGTKNLSGYLWIPILILVIGVTHYDRKSWYDDDHLTFVNVAFSFHNILKSHNKGYQIFFGYLSCLVSSHHDHLDVCYGARMPNLDRAIDCNDINYSCVLIGVLVFNVTNGKGLHFELMSFTQCPT